MMAATRQSARPFPPLVLDDAGSLEDMAAAVMRLHSTLMTVGRCYTTDATGDRAALELGRVESVLAGAFCTIFGQSPADRFADIFDQVTFVADHMVKDHIFEDGNKRTSLVFALSVLRFAGTPVVLSDSPEPKDNQYYAWIQDLVSSRRTNSELAEELRCGFVAGTDDLSLVKNLSIRTPVNELIGHHMELPSTLCSNVYDFAFCPEPCYDRLVDLADPEDWGPGNRILKNYLSFSFSRAVFLTERDVDQTAPSNLPLVFEDDRCLFNTGLYTRRYETIYGLFEPNTKPAARQRWFLKGFFKESDPMLVSFEYLPCRVRFAEDPSELVFDYRLPIRSNIDHILGDEENLTRIPASLMGEGNSLLLRRAFEGAVVEAARRAAANYTLAVPQFYGGRIQLLLPLCLTGDKPELALTIQREDGFYAARTCLTLDMAYNNARLICRPETSWIKR